jgi:predicted O-linked N-acetylglucosamine transferase (SPINDLY family)
MTMKKVERNDPCPCGSGKKYKQCCLKRDETLAASRRAETATNPQALQAAMAHHQAGRLPQAETIYQQILQAEPNHPEALHFSGIIAHQTGRNDLAVELIGKALSIKPGVVEAHNNIGLALQTQGNLDGAVEHYRKALAIKPDYADAYYNLGNVLKRQFKWDEAINSYQKALSLKPGFAEVHYNLGNALKDQGKPDGAIEHYHKALSFKPNYPDAWNNLASTLLEQGMLDTAVENFHKALLLKPEFAEALNNLGNALKDQGKLDEAIECFQKALAIKSDYAEAHSNFLYTLNYHSDLSAEDIYRAYREYEALRGFPLRSTWRAHDNDRNPDRRLRVGYVSPDFRYHSCRCYLEPLLAHHDKNQVEVFAYAELSKEDDMTARYKSYVEHWIPTKGMSDEALAQRIRSDGIDILVELAGHTACNRLLTFARKPAPVSLSWLGYGYTTGLSAIDYYLTDETCVPKGSEGLFSEQPWRIATPAYAYRPIADMGEVNCLPALQRGYITFGTLTRSVRVNYRTIRVWSAILNAVPNSRLVMDSLTFKEIAMQERMAARFAEHGITRERLEMGYHSPPWDTLRGLDIGLDCFPHNSGATLFETLYMGVPYITLAGRPSVGRLGSCILQGVDHQEWIAGSEDEYVAKAVELASDITRLSETRSKLREQMEMSALRDEVGLARKVEDAYRGMWKIWCEKGC